MAAVEFTARYLLAPQLHALADAGYDIRLACHPLGDTFHDSLRRFCPRQLSFPRTTDARSLARASRQLSRLVQEIQPDLVHFHSPAAALPGRLSMVTHRRHRPMIAYTVHGFPYQWDRRTIHSGWLMPAEWFLSFVTDLLLFQSQEDLEQAQRHHFRGRATYLGNGVGDEWFSTPRSAPAERPDGVPIQAVFVGRLTREKGLLDLLHALQSTSGVALTVIGEALPSDRDPITVEARDLVRSAHLPVTFTGHLEPAEIRAHLLASDLFILPSWREGIPRSIIEAMACRLPVLATDIRGCRELVTHDVTGWLVPPQDPTALARAVSQVPQLGRSTLSSMGAAGFTKVELEFRESRVIERLLGSYRQLGLAGPMLKAT